METFILNIILTFILISALLMIIFRNTYFVKVIWKYSLILIPVFFLVITRLINKKPNDNIKKDDTTIAGIKDKLNEANMISAIEVSAAREDNKVRLDELKRISSIKDDQERRKSLSNLMG